MIVSITTWNATCDACGNLGVRGVGTRDELHDYLRKDKWLFASNRCVCTSCLQIYEEVNKIQEEHCLLLELEEAEVKA